MTVSVRMSMSGAECLPRGVIVALRSDISVARYGSVSGGFEDSLMLSRNYITSYIMICNFRAELAYITQYTPSTYACIAYRNFILVSCQD